MQEGSDRIRPKDARQSLLAAVDGKATQSKGCAVEEKGRALAERQSR